MTEALAQRIRERRALDRLAAINVFSLDGCFPSETPAAQSQPISFLGDTPVPGVVAGVTLPDVSLKHLVEAYAGVINSRGGVAAERTTSPEQPCEPRVESRELRTGPREPFDMPDLPAFLDRRIKQ